MSSAKDIQYKTKEIARHFISILEQGLQLEGADKKITNITCWGSNRSNRNLLSRQETKGNYVPLLPISRPADSSV